MPTRKPGSRFVYLASFCLFVSLSLSLHFSHTSLSLLSVFSFSLVLCLSVFFLCLSFVFFFSFINLFAFLWSAWFSFLCSPFQSRKGGGGGLPCSLLGLSDCSFSSVIVDLFNLHAFQVVWYCEVNERGLDNVFLNFQSLLVNHVRVAIAVTSHRCPADYHFQSLLFNSLAALSSHTVQMEIRVRCTADHRPKVHQGRMY